MSFNIKGTGMYVPEKIVTNDDLSKIVETNDEWIAKRVGVKRRHISTGETAADDDQVVGFHENASSKPQMFSL